MTEVVAKPFPFLDDGDLIVQSSTSNALDVSASMCRLAFKLAVAAWYSVHRGSV